MAVDKSNFLLPNNQRFVELDSSQAFNNLTKQEKLYAHYLSQVSPFKIEYVVFIVIIAPFFVDWIIFTVYQIERDGSVFNSIQYNFFQDFFLKTDFDFSM